MSVKLKWKCAYCGLRVTEENGVLKHQQVQATADGPKRFFCDGWAKEGPKLAPDLKS